MSDFITLDIETLVNPNSGWTPKPWELEKVRGDISKIFPPPHAQRPLAICGCHFKHSSDGKRTPSFQDWGPDEDVFEFTEEHEYKMLVAMNTYLGNVLQDGSGTIVTFNGRGFDFIVLVNRCMYFGIDTSLWQTKEFLYRYSAEGHADLLELLSEYGAVGKNRPSLALISKQFGMPGKMGIDGSEVTPRYEQGLAEKDSSQFRAIREYCLADNFETAVVYLRWLLMKGKIYLWQYRQIIMDLLQACKEQKEDGEFKYPFLAEFAQACDMKKLLIPAFVQ